MKEVYAIPDRHTRYVTTKEIFRTKMTEGSSVQDHEVKMLSLVEKLDDLKAGLNNDTYIDVILQSLPPSYNPFIVNFNMNVLEKSINELINMLVQYEATSKKSAPSVLVGETSTSKVKGKRPDAGRGRRVRQRRRLSSQQKTLQAIPLLQWEWARERGRWVLSSSRGQTICAPIVVRKGIEKGIVPNSLPSKVLQRSRKLSKDEVVLRLGDGKTVAAEVIWHARLGHISQDRIKRLVDSKSLKIDNLDNLPAYVSGPLNTQARGEFFYFITFIDDHSLYGYVYLMRYKYEAFVWFKEFRLEVENPTGCKIKILRSDRGGEYLSGEFPDYLKENGIVSPWTPPRTPQLNGMTARSNRTLLDIVRGPDTISDMARQACFLQVLESVGSPAYVKRLVGNKLDLGSSLCRFIGYPKETIGYYFYDPSKQKVFVSTNAVFLERGFPADTRRNELLLEESSEAPQSNAGTSSAPIASIDNVPVLRRSAGVPQPPKRYDFLGVTGQLDNDPKTYGEAMSDIDSGK
ncbi:UNVERIFIED_CONTAM: hypothetical protein Slati_4478100 [Sesamum latifolium]|uniref:Integrase catalytic domain-containing protein n=1 Tax=Sesamum latifolium TaxID=2727402 RepID=A0AAW2SSR2_9LAMI